ncbi:DinB family protein [Nocardioides jejuensis]|uniref:Maleylpyruvate isomerase family mycothiol-dependent enzyme n=1 Tax=Nocardioides jejuensis TaxID=2502782 RepID=A0A4R1CHB7_9ACTN|nr:DinB family protein [Nocardioides jejuensis]TCJ30803.1 maleylpyruvate isomerase family mycothiol-dependent enzyme [Nocardioides jejuensis]
MSEQATADNPITAVLEATQRYLTTVAGLTEEQLREPSVLPGWTRAHVVAHVALNAHGFAGALRGLRTGTPTPVYASDEQRDADIESYAAASLEQLQAFTQMQCLRIAGELNMLKAVGSVERTPGGTVLSVVDVVELRWREVEIHHADLGLDYSPADWPATFAAYLVEEAAWDRGEEFTATLHAQDIGKTFRVGAGGHGIAGTAGALAWWLVGRGTGDDLVAIRGLPTLGPWKRRTRVQ